MLSIRFLLVDDFELWRRVAASIVQKNPNWVVVAEASSGLEAIQKAEQLQPDVILLDIGLQMMRGIELSGIEAAERIVKVAPNSRIVMLSQESDTEVVQQALKSGAIAYVYKPCIQRDLFPAIESALSGRQFVSSGLRDFGFGHGRDTQAIQCHEVQFHSDDAVFVESLTRFVTSALVQGNAAIVFATKPHRDGLWGGLRAQGIDVDEAVRRGIWISLDAADTLATFMVDDWPDAVRFSEGVGKLTESALKATTAKSPRVAIFGEAVALLWKERKINAAVRLEQLGNDLAKTYPADILCGYPLSVFHDEDKHAFRFICSEHSAVHFT